MQTTTAPIVKDLVLVGGGHSQLAVLKRFAMQPLPGLRITLVTRDLHTPYSGMLPGYIAGHYDYDQTHIDLRRLAQFAGARIYHSEVSGLDLNAHQVVCKNRPPVHYDVLSINIGSRPGTLHVPGAARLSLPIKPINHFLNRWETLLERVKKTDREFRLLVVGGGAGGVEMALSAQYRLQQVLQAAGKRPDLLSVKLLTETTGILPTHNAGVRARFERILIERNIAVLPGQLVTEVRNEEVLCDTGQRIAGDAVLWLTNASAPAWLGESGMEVDKQGFIRVNDYLQSTSHPEVFASGDIASSDNHPRPKSGVFAVRQGPPLAENLRRFARQQPLKKFKPQTHFLGLISTGNRYAIASRADWSLEGAWLWRIKDHIDRRFMQQFNQLPEMPNHSPAPIDSGLAGSKITSDEISAASMRCGGCGAKVGSGLLSRVLKRLQPVEREDILLGLNSADDAAVASVPSNKVIVQSVDYFRSFIDDPYLFGQIAAHHALSDLFAMGAETQSALAIATLPYGLEADVEEQLYQLMSGALKALNQSQTALVGGHSSEGAELAFGLSVTGLADQEQILHKRGLRAGDALILTKALGTGTLFAADMRHRAKGRWIDAAIEQMLVSNQSAGQCLQQHGATACTDVTGFGLLGHLLEMTGVSRCSAKIKLDSLPALRGSRQSLAAGIHSSLQPQNQQYQQSIRNHKDFQKHPNYALLFDPQTAGGLLAGVPASRAEACIEELVSLGYPAATTIGTLSQNAEEDARIELQ